MRATRRGAVAVGSAAIVAVGWAGAPTELGQVVLGEQAEDPSPTPTVVCEPNVQAAQADDDHVDDDDDRYDDDRVDDDDDRYDDDRRDDDDDHDDDTSASAGETCTTVTPAPDAVAGETFDGPVVTNLRGDFQARIVVADGVVVDVVALAAGTSAAESQRINAEAIPALSARVLEAQSADVDAYSGASYSSPGFLESVAGAFDAAGL